MATVAAFNREHILAAMVAEPHDVEIWRGDFVRTIVARVRRLRPSSTGWIPTLYNRGCEANYYCTGDHRAEFRRRHSDAHFAKQRHKS